MKSLINTKLMEILIKRAGHNNMQNPYYSLCICDRQITPGNPAYGIPDQVTLIPRSPPVLGYISNSPGRMQLDNQESFQKGECTAVILAKSISWASITTNTRAVYQGKVYTMQLQPQVGIELGKEILYQFRLIPEMDSSTYSQPDSILE